MWEGQTGRRLAFPRMIMSIIGLASEEVSDPRTDVRSSTEATREARQVPEGRRVAVSLVSRSIIVGRELLPIYRGTRDERLTKGAGMRA